MRALLQRISSASVTVDGSVIGESGPGLMILVCAMQGDDEAQVDQLAAKIAKLRIFKDDAGKMNRSILDIQGSALVVSQFTLAADTSRGNRPGFSGAGPCRRGRTALYCVRGVNWRLGASPSKLVHLALIWRLNWLMTGR